MSTERAIFFLHADPVPDEYSNRSLKTYLMTQKEVFIDFGGPRTTIRIKNPQHASLFCLRSLDGFRH